ncbi:MAG: hypothetical protein PHU43_11155 [Candidatus Bipolaricaulis sp.]|nr:hypothetical protein [Candidatus Bipolaricaulis sp.]
MNWIVVANNGRILWAGNEPTAHINSAKARLLPIPVQDLRFVHREGATGAENELILGEALYSDIPLRYTDAEIAAAWAAWTDRETDRVISDAVHPFAPVGEQIGILRDQLVQLLNALGMEATPDFARLNEVAVKAIEAARAKKEAL